MIKTIVKRDGSSEAFSAKKINDWGRWAAQSKVDWSSVVMDTCSQLPETVSSTKLQDTLIQTCINRGTWSYSLMAGRLLAPHLHKTVYPEGIPTIQQLHQKLVGMGLMVDLGYSDAEYAALEEVIDHERDFNQPEFSLTYTLEKYSIQNRAKKEYYETAQFTYMRVAMAIASNLVNTEDRIAKVSAFYDSFSYKKVSPPTPNYINLGTPLRGFASCCLIAAGDNVDSIGIADWLAYRMTAASAGIGTNYMTRSLGDPVRNGSIVHNGKLPYLTSMAKSVKANVQAGRGGAGTTYYNGFDPQADFISQLRNPKATEDKRLRDVHFALMTNRTFAEKVAKDEDAVAWNIFTAPELHDAFYSGDREKFAKLYAEYEASGKGKTIFSPRKLLVRAMNEAFETGVAYLANIDEINRHTPFNEPIHSSNLCVAPETTLLTTDGYIRISTLVGKTVSIWNGQEWSDVEVRQTGVDHQLVTVTLTDGRNLDCTLYHKWYVRIDDQVVEKRTHELTVGDRLIDTVTPGVEWDGVVVETGIVESIADNGRIDDTYCVTEPKRHMAVFNGILTGQCLEIAEPTYPYFKMEHTVATSDVGYVTFKFNDGDQTYERTSAWSARKIIKRDGLYKTTYAGDLKVGDIIVDNDDDGFEVDLTVTEIVDKLQEPEVAMCSLAAINVAEVKTDRDYEEQMYTALSMIDYCILNSEYPVPHIGFTAKQRMNAGVGIMGLATLMAEYQLKYDTPEGLAFIHRVAERHMYFAIKASLRISKERGNAPWIHKTKWVDGWTPVQTYAKGVDKLGDFKYEYDWDALSVEIRQNGGIAHSCLVAYMPGESSSKALGQPNSIYPVRSTVLAKTDNATTIEWLAPEGDNPYYHYQSAWDTDPLAQLNFYAVFQKFTDQTISADMWMSVKGDMKVPSSRMIQLYLHMYKVGVKTRYYLNSQTSSNDGTLTQKVISEIDDNCSGGGCKI